MKIIVSQVTIVLLIAMAFVMCQPDKTNDDDSYTTTASTSPDTCGADASWFAINPTTQKRFTQAPKEDSASVFGNDTTVTNCDFHRWSWQKFLWLTNDINGKPLFLAKLLQVDAQTTLINSPDTILLAGSDSIQATGNVMKSNKSYNNNDSNYMVFYSIHVDSSLYHKIHHFASKTPSTYADSSFPVGALELKIAWVNVDALRDTSDYFITQGKIDGLPTRIALLGMHVTGIVYNHPEFVWATFEHDDMVPYYNWDSTTATADWPVTTNTNYLFFDSTATGTLDSIITSSSATNIFAVNRYGTPRQAGNTFLVTSQTGSQNFNNIDSINSSVKAQISSTEVWKNYFYNGSIWINTEGYSYPVQQAQLLVNLGSTLSNSSPGKLTRGSVAAYNITMETYEQLGFSPTSIHGQDTSSLGNCFSCHTASKGSALNISHIFNGAVGKASTGETVDETRARHKAELKTFIESMKK